MLVKYQYMACSGVTVDASQEMDCPNLEAAKVKLLADNDLSITPIVSVEGVPVPKRKFNREEKSLRATHSLHLKHATITATTIRRAQ